MTKEPDWVPLVEAARAGDLKARGELLARFEPLTIAMARRLAPADRVDDVVQQTYTVALETLAGLRTPEAFPSWLRLLVRKQASRIRTDAGISHLEPTPETADQDVGPAALAEQREVAAAVRVALAAARDQDRRILELRYLAGWSNDEIADLLGISTGTLRKRLHDARRRLRPHLEHLNPKEPTMTDYRAYLGAVHDPTIDVPPAPSLHSPTDAVTVTGLKVIDALAPVRRGGTIEMIGPAGTGHLVVAMELLYRLGRTEDGVACIGVGRTGSAIGSQPDIGSIVTEEGLPGPNAAILTSGPADSSRGFEMGARIAAGLAANGLDVILAVDQPTLQQLSADALTAAAGLADSGSVTVIAVNALDRGADAPEPIGLDATLVFSIEHLALGIFPAIDGSRSRSILGITESARTTKQRLAEAATLRAWFNQPMYVAQNYTGEDGTWIEPETVSAELAALTS